MTAASERLLVELADKVGELEQRLAQLEAAPAKPARKAPAKKAAARKRP